MSVNITFLNIKLPSVVAHLEKTDTNYDTCVFMTYETAQEIMSSEKWYETFREEPITDELASSVMIRIENGADKKDVARNINFKMDKASPVSAYTTNTIMSEAMAASESMKGYTSVLISTHDLSFINDEMKHYVMKKGVMTKL